MPESLRGKLPSGTLRLASQMESAHPLWSKLRQQQFIQNGAWSLSGGADDPNTTHERVASATQNRHTGPGSHQAFIPRPSTLKAFNSRMRGVRGAADWEIHLNSVNSFQRVFHDDRNGPLKTETEMFLCPGETHGDLGHSTSHFGSSESRKSIANNLTNIRRLHDALK